MTQSRPLARKMVRSLARCLESRRADGRREAVLFFGNGLHIQAFAEAEDTEGDPWTAALRVITRSLDGRARRRLKNFPRYHHALIDELRSSFSLSRRRQGDASFLTRLSEELETQSLRAEGLPLYEQLRLSEFANVLTCCVDETLPLAVGAQKRKPPGTYYSREMYRKSVYRLGDHKKPSDLWHINGTVETPDGIRLGSLFHAEIIAELEQQRIRLMNAWRNSSGQLKRPAEFAAERGPFAFNWFKQFMVMPLVFVGTSLHPSNWTTWWLLHQRSRVFAVFPPQYRPPTMVLTAEPLPYLAGSPANLEVVEFASTEELWDVLRTLLSR